MKNEQPKKKKPDALKEYGKYSSLAFQMVIIIGGLTWLGHWIDSFTGWHFPVFLVVFAMLSVVLAIYYAIKDLIKFK
jgi:ATP synthase protein I